MSEEPVKAVLDRLSSANSGVAWSEFLQNYSPVMMRMVRRFESDHGRKTLGEVRVLRPRRQLSLKSGPYGEKTMRTTSTAALSCIFGVLVAACGTGDQGGVGLEAEAKPAALAFRAPSDVVHVYNWVDYI